MSAVDQEKVVPLRISAKPNDSVHVTLGVPRPGHPGGPLHAGHIQLSRRRWEAFARQLGVNPWRVAGP